MDLLLKFGAMRHGETFKRASAAFMATKPLALDIVEDEEWKTVYATMRRPPDDLSTIIGDIVHQQRSALDALACDLARISGAKSTAGVYFPVAKDKAGFEDRRSLDKIKKLHRAHLRVSCAEAGYGHDR